MKGKNKVTDDRGFTFNVYCIWMYECNVYEYWAKCHKTDHIV